MPAASKRHVALLRGINVGKNNRLAMSDLRTLLENLGYADVRTHLNSGNAVFTVTGRARPETVAKKIEQAISAELGMTLRVVVRTRDELAKVVEANPLADVMQNPSRLLVTFLSDSVPAKSLRDIGPEAFLPELFALTGRELYLWLPGGFQNSPLLKALDGKPDGVATTSRNWNTVTRLLELAG
jgi:uncharacterized protein (DUF1697 family)